MSKQTFQGRVVLPGEVTGTATVSRQAFNTSGSYFENMFAGRTEGAPCTDSSNAELFGKLQRSKWIVEAKSHRQINVLRLGDPDLRHLTAQIGDHGADALGDKPGRIVDERYGPARSSNQGGNGRSVVGQVKLSAANRSRVLIGSKQGTGT